MKIMKIFVFLFLVIEGTIFSQNLLFKANFEAPDFPINWTQKMVKPDYKGEMVPWQIWDETNEKPNPNPHPDTAASGQYYPYFLFSGSSGEATRLITPQMNMLGKVKPMLDFYLIQKRWDQGSGFVNNNFSILFRSGTDTNYYLIKQYLLGLSNWNHEQILLPDSILKSNFYLAFQGTNLGGPIIGIDSIKIYETNVAPRQVLLINLTQPSSEYITNNTINNPIARLDIYIGGNQNNLTFNSLKISSQNSNDLDLSSNGVKLFKTTDTIWNSPIQIPVSADFISGKALLSGINENLSSGLNTFWITYDIASNATAGHIADLSIAVNDINIGGNTFPSTVLNPQGNRNIRQLLLFDDFETDKMWILKGDFQRQAPNKKGGAKGSGSFGLPDPEFAYSGSTIIGNDLSGMEADLHGNGNYLPNILKDDSCYAETPEINCKFFKNIHLRFQRQLGVHFMDKAKIMYSHNGGVTWKEFWTNEEEGGSIADNIWRNKEYNLTNFADRIEHFKLRFVLGPTTNDNLACGWNIDDVTISADTVANDVGVTEWLSPLTGCGKSTAEEVRVRVKNFANKNSPNKIPLEFTINGSTYYKDTLVGSLSPGQEVDFTFTQKVDLSTPAYYANVKASTTLSIDDDNRNNQKTVRLYSLGLMSVPYIETFETNNLWISDSTLSIWQYGRPTKPNYMDGAYSGSKAFATYLTSFYSNNQSGFIESPCVDLSSATNPAVSFHFVSHLEKLMDGVALYSSIDNGASWELVPNHIYPWKGNWYKNNVAALGSKGWDTTTNAKWIHARQILPASLIGQGSVKFRFVFKSNASNEFAGFAFDDFSIINAPTDIQIVSIDSISNACIGSNSNRLSFTLRNAGIRPILPSETLQVSYSINGSLAISENFQVSTPLAVNDTKVFKFQTPANQLNSAGDFNISIIAKDPMPGFYESNNDTAKKSISIYALPFTALPDTISSARLDTTYIRPHTDNDYIYTWPDNSHLSTWQNITPNTYWVEIKINDPNGCSIRDSFVLRKLNRDYSINKIVSPQSNCTLNNSSSVSFSFKNIGTDTLEKKDIASVQVRYKYNNATPVTQNFNFTDRLKPNDSLVFTFTTPLIGISSGASLKLYLTQIALDVNKSNDTLVNSLLEFGYPSVDIGNNLIIYAADYELDAGPGFKTYLWNDNTNQQTYKAKFVGKHWVRVTDFNNCAASDTAYITVLRHDLQVKKHSNPANSCKLTSAEKVILELFNSGTDTIFAGTSINIGYKLGSSALINENLILPQNLLPQSSIEYEFAQKADLSAIGEYRLTSFAKISGDMVTGNDTLKDTVNVYGYPALDLGPDLIIENLQYTLDAGAGINRVFLWQDNKTDQQYLVTKSGSYSVNVTNPISGCKSYDTIHVNLVIKDGGITSITNPTNNKACSGTFKSMTVAFKNTGTTTLTAGQIIEFTSITRGIVQKETITLSSPLLADDSITHTFNGMEYIFIPGNNNFSISSTMQGDMQINNDTLHTFINVYSTPTVELGGINGHIEAYNNSVTLNAGNGTGYSYLWEDGTTIQTKTLNNTGTNFEKHYVRVTEPNGCVNSDTAWVFIKFPNVKIKEFSKPISNCYDDINVVNIICRNAGNNSLNKNDTIHLNLQTIANGASKTNINNSLILKNEVQSGDTFSFTYKDMRGNIEIGSNKLKFFCRNLYDIDKNDTFTYNLTVNPSPSFNLEDGKDSIFTQPPYPLTVGLGSDYTYLWQNGATTDPLNADTTAWYRVTATDKTTNCSYTDSIYIDMEINDMEVSNIVFDANKCMNELDGFNIEINNSGNRIIAANETIQVKYVLNETKTETFNITFPQGLASKEKYYVACKGLKSEFKIGTNTIIASIVYSKDITPTNDNLTSTFTMHYKPELSLSSVNDSIELMKPYSLTAGSNGSYNYAWSNGATGRVIEVGQSKKYVVTATDPASGCTNKDSIFALLDVFDGITSASTPDPLCMSQINSLTVKFRNNGKYVFEAGTSIEMGYIFNNNQSDKANIVLAQALNPGQEVSKTFNGLSTYNILGTNSIKAYSSTTLDTVKQNDTATLVLNLLISPSVSIAGGDTIYLDAPFLITAASPDDVNYLWNTGETSNSIKVINSGKYKVKAVNKINTCYASDSVFVYPMYTDGSISKAELSPSCFNTTNSITVTYKNVGQINLIKGDTLDIYYRFNTSSIKVIRQFLASDIEKNESKQISMNINRTGLVAGSNNILVYVKNKKDQNSINDTIRTSITLNASPTVNLAGGKDLVSFTGSYKLDAGAGFKSYLWNTKATSQSITVAASGWIGVTVTNTLGCAGWDSVLMQMRTDVIESLVANKNLNIYPVPAKTHFSIEIKEVNLTDPILEIYSSDMKLVLKEHYIAISEGFTKTFTSTDWEKGIYYVCIREKSGKILLSNKFLIQ